MILQPKCSCLDCRSYSFVYNSILDLHKCLECDSKVQMKPIDSILDAFKSYNANIAIVPKYTKLHCLKCNTAGSLQFKNYINDTVFCPLCDYYLYMTSLCDVMTNKYKTLLLEKSFNTFFKC
jgi:hypothetical protein